MRVFREASVTALRHPVPAVVCVKAEAMDDAWCIATSRSDQSGPEIVAKYGKRFSIEEMFRDVKDLRFGMGLGWRTVDDAKRRDRIFLIAALAMDLLTLPGHAGEAAGIDRVLKTNTSKKRTLSLFRQGLLWYERIPTMPEERLRTLMHHFGSLILDHRIYRLSVGLECGDGSARARLHPRSRVFTPSSRRPRGRAQGGPWRDGARRGCAGHATRALVATRVAAPKRIGVGVGKTGQRTRRRATGIVVRFRFPEAEMSWLWVGVLGGVRRRAGGDRRSATM